LYAGGSLLMMVTFFPTFLRKPASPSSEPMASPSGRMCVVNTILSRRRSLGSIHGDPLHSSSTARRLTRRLAAADDIGFVTPAPPERFEYRLPSDTDDEPYDPSPGLEPAVHTDLAGTDLSAAAR